MNRRWLLSMMGVIGVGAVIPFALDRSSGAAQDTTDARLNNLETRVAALETEVVGGTAIPAAATPGTPSASGALTFTGAGEQLVGPFHLDAGNYIVDVSVNGQKYDFADVKLREVGGTSDTELLTVFNGAPFHGQLLVTVAESGEYRLISSGSGGAKWTVTFTPE